MSCGASLAKVFSLRSNAKITQQSIVFILGGTTKKKKMKQSDLDICTANQVTIITFKEISMTIPSVQAKSHMLALTWGSETPNWVEGWDPVQQLLWRQINGWRESTALQSLTGKDHNTEEVKWTLWGKKALLHINLMKRKKNLNCRFSVEVGEMRLFLRVNMLLVSACVLAAKGKILGVQNQLKKLRLQ